jgi:hypothetical protein
MIRDHPRWRWIVDVESAHLELDAIDIRTVDVHLGYFGGNMIWLVCVCGRKVREGLERGEMCLRGMYILHPPVAKDFVQYIASKIPKDKHVVTM